MQLSREQKQVARTALRVAERLGASPKVKKALIAAGLVESNLRNVNYGDRDSLGFLQQRPSQGWGSPEQVRDVEHATEQFVRRAKPIRRKYGTAGQLAQAVQRSAFPAKYDQRGGDAEAVLRALRGDSAGGSSRRSEVETSSRTIPGKDRSAERQALKLSYLRSRGNPDALLDLAAGLDEAQDTPDRTVTSSRRVKPRRSSKPKGDGRTNIDELARLAKKMGLHVGEHPKHGGVAPVHTANSYHYRGAALDISGSAEAMARYARVVKRRYGRDLEELFYRGPGSGKNVKHGKRVGRNFVSGHEGHVHVADDD